VIAACFVLGITIFRYVGLKVGFVPTGLVYYAGASNEFRVIGSGPALFMAMVGLALAAWWMRERPARWAGLLALILLGAAFVLQHRSVWLSMAAGILVLAVLDLRGVERRLPALVLLTLSLGLAASFLLAFGQLDRLTQTMTDSVANLGNDRGTHLDRLHGWYELLKDWVGYSPREWLLGRSYGAGYARYVFGRLEEFSPHNLYVQTLLRIGLVGLSALIAAYLVALVGLRRLRAAAGADPLSANILIALLIGSLVYFVAYQADYTHGAVIGLALALIAGNAARVVPARDRVVRPRPGSLVAN
jgi:O-antigen ligase